MKLFNPKTVVQFLGFEKEEKVGYLWKRRSERKGSFKKRYFIVCGNLLAYYEKKSDQEPLGVIILEGHVLELLDDLTIALRFPSVNGSSRSCVLRADSQKDIEDWMRVLSRTGIDFFTLTLEDLEDQLGALNSVKKSTQFTSPESGHTPQKETSIHSAERVNPFNMTPALSALTGASTSNVVPSQAPSSSQTPAPLTGSKSISAPSSGMEHLCWLFSQSWEELHGRVRSDLLKCIPSTSDKDLISFT